MSAEILDGRSLAARRHGSIARRAANVSTLRARPPTLLLAAFPSDDGIARHVRGKVLACAAAGVEAVPLVLDPSSGTAAVVAAIEAAIAAHRPDAVFVQVPVPEDLGVAAVLAAIPHAADVDIMTDAAFASYMSGASSTPPVTISAALELLDVHSVDIRGLGGVVAAEESPFSIMFAEALRRRGAIISPILEPGSPHWDTRIAGAQLLVAAVGRPGAVRSADVAAGAVVLDIGYFNEGARGDVDVSTGVEHLRALMPVPGGVGPMTVSVLVERVVAFSEGSMGLG